MNRQYAAVFVFKPDRSEMLPDFLSGAEAGAGQKAATKYRTDHFRIIDQQYSL
jgi:hypothetical protein